jgi:uncharacterized membrane protein
MWGFFKRSCCLNLRRLTFTFLFTYAVLTAYGMVLAVLKSPQPFPLTPISILLAFCFSILHAGQREGARRAILLVVIIFVTGLAFESVGVATGLVYGPYHYTDQLGPKFLGLVPFLIPLAWTMMMYPSLVIADRLISKKWTRVARWVAVAALGGVVMTAWDVAMDPMMVLGGNWVWDVKGAYFGVPLQNYWGWWLTTFFALGLYQAGAHWLIDRPRGISHQWAVWSYLITVVSTVLVDLALGLEGPALAGLFAVVPWIIIGFIRETR